jgi:SAM-dependent methyltransferase
MSLPNSPSHEPSTAAGGLRTGSPQADPPSEWVNAEYALGYLARLDRVPHRVEGEAVLLEGIPSGTRRVLDLGTGDGHLLALVLAARPGATGVALDFSPAMLEAARARFKGLERVRIVDHDLDRPLPELGSFDAVISSFAIHHLPHPRKRALYREVFGCLEPGGIFANLEHVAPGSPALHQRFLKATGGTEDPSNKLLEVEIQLAWLREIGFTEVDCHWKWLELALLGGRR